MPARDDLFDDDVSDSMTSESATSGKPFAQYLRETPPAPLPQGIKILLWAAGGLTLILFLASLLKMAN